MGPTDRALAFITDVLANDRAIAAVADDGTLLGVAGYKYAGRGFTDGSLRDIRRHYGLIGMCWRVPFLAMLERAEAPGTLQMDGICVSDAARGRGVGTALLEAIAAKRQALNCERVALHVIDINPRARALYTRLGYQPGKVEKIGPLRHLFGFQSATRMELSLQSANNPAQLT